MIKRFRKATILLLIFGIALTTYVFNANAETVTYTVHRLKDNGEIDSQLSEFTDFSAAYAAMNQEATKNGPNVIVRSTASKSPLKIVAADRAMAQSYPYRAGTINTVVKNTLDIFSNQALTSTKSYLPAHYTMYVHNYLKQGNSLVVEVEIQGARGFVDIDKVDIIPLLFIEKKIPIQLGGNENYYDEPESPYLYVVEPEKYTVSTNNTYKVNELHVHINRSHPNTSNSVSTYAIAPSWMKTGVDYYSKDGINFFEDLENTISPKDAQKFYAYFQWLPVRSLSNYNADDFNKIMVDYGYSSDSKASKYSVIVDNEHAFVEYGMKYGMNSLLLFAQAALESAYGSSNLAKNRYNLFGWNAVDSNPNLASSYEGVQIAIENQMSGQLSGYFKQSDWRFEGYSFGSKNSGVTVRYASDPYYGIKISAIAYQADRRNNFKDYNAYALAVIDDKTGLNVRKDATTSAPTWYTTKNNKVNQVITNLEIKNEFIKTNLPQAIKNNGLTTENLPIDLTKEFGYLSTDYVKTLTSNGPTTAQRPTERITVSDTKQKMMTTANLNVRSWWSTNGRVLTMIPKGTEVNVSLTSNGWAKVTFKNITGFVSAEYLEIPDGSGGTPPVPDESGGTPQVPDESGGTPPVPDDVVLGDLSGDGKITTLDALRMKKYLSEEITLDAKALIAADINKDGKVSTLDAVRLKKHLSGEIVIGE